MLPAFPAEEIEQRITKNYTVWKSFTIRGDIYTEECVCPPLVMRSLQVLAVSSTSQARSVRSPGTSPWPADLQELGPGGLSGTFCSSSSAALPRSQTWWIRAHRTGWRSWKAPGTARLNPFWRRLGMWRQLEEMDCTVLWWVIHGWSL